MMKKYHILICFVHFEFVVVPLFSMITALLLSWNRVLVESLCPCFWRKYCVHGFWGNASFSPMSSALGKLFTDNFFSLDKLVTAPWLSIIMEQMCPWQSSRIDYDTLTSHSIMPMLSAFNILPRFYIPFVFSTHFSFSNHLHWGMQLAFECPIWHDCIWIVVLSHCDEIQYPNLHLALLILYFLLLWIIICSCYCCWSMMNASKQICTRDI